MRGRGRLLRKLWRTLMNEILLTAWFVVYLGGVFGFAAYAFMVWWKDRDDPT